MEPASEESASTAKELWEEVATIVETPKEVALPLLDVWARSLRPPAEAVRVAEPVWEDCGILPWLRKSALTQGGAAFATRIFQSPSADVATLRGRQEALRALPADTKRRLRAIVPLEDDLLWLFSLPPLRDAPSLQLLFPQTLFVRAINLSSLSLALFHAYRGYLAPCMHLVGPFTTVFGPYLYMRRQMRVPMRLAQYLAILWKMARVVVQPTGQPRHDVVKLGTLVLYAVMFVLGLVQSIDIARTVRFMRRRVLERLARLKEFAFKAQELQRRIPSHVWEAFGIPGGQAAPELLKLPPGIRGMYALLTQDAPRATLLELARRMYVLDACCIVRTRGMCFVSFPRSSEESRHAHLWNMGHPALPARQVRNPASLEKSLIVTGPNAAGKTTYVKSLCSNILLAQSFGVACAKACVLTPYHHIATFMRVSDTLGDASLFQAEAKRCADILRQCRAASDAGQRSVVFLDEPMHSTPPLEGAATSMATIEHLGHLPGTRVVTTTHYFAITHLADTAPDSFVNVSMEATLSPTGGFLFPYRIRQGPSCQCIALELLEDSDLPREVAARAMEWRNKLCAREVAKNDC
jgi:hypothetical protein